MRRAPDRGLRTSPLRSAQRDDHAHETASHLPSSSALRSEGIIHTLGVKRRRGKSYTRTHEFVAGHNEHNQCKYAAAAHYAHADDENRREVNFMVILCVRVYARASFAFSNFVFRCFSTRDQLLRTAVICL